LTAALLGQDGPRTKAVRQADQRGVHTTTHRELWVLPNGASLIDNPGIRELGMTIDSADSPGGFEALFDLANRCRFADCSHQAEPGCAVQAAIAAGELPADHLVRWRKQQAEVGWLRQRELTKDRQAASDKEKWEAGAEDRRWRDIQRDARNRARIERELGRR
jgi:ribosome biogenesis GTPase